jgi:hypothetical protein
MLAEPSGDASCGDAECGCGDPPVRYSGAHTATICPDCDAECWDLSGSAYERGRKLEQDAARKAAREGTASPQLPQRELDRQARELRQRRSLVLAVVGKVLADAHLTGQCRSDWEWFAEQIPGASAERLAELEQQIREQPVDRGGWFRRSFGRGDEYLLWVAEDGPDDEDQADNEDQDAEVIQLPGAGDRLALEQAPRITGNVLCEPCVAQGSQSLAVARIRTSVPTMIPEQDACPDHFREYAALIQRQTFGELLIVKHYGTAPGVRSITRAMSAAAWTAQGAR